LENRLKNPLLLVMIEPERVGRGATPTAGALRRFGFEKNEITGRGFRSASSMLNESGLWHPRCDRPDFRLQRSNRYGSIQSHDAAEEEDIAVCW
jgi:hypothetical protein